MITGNLGDLERSINLSCLEINLLRKPILHGGAAMEYYGLRKRGQDYDFIITNDDYLALVDKYPHNKKDLWGDLGVFAGEYEFFRSIYRFDYDFFLAGAKEYETFCVISFEKLFLLKALSFKTSPDVWKLTNDFELMVNYIYTAFQNPAYVENQMKHIKDYLAAPNGVIYNDNYT